MAPTPIYFDNNATTRTDPRVVEAMLPYFSQFYGNAASHGHLFGWQAEEAVERGRSQVAGLIGADPREIVFTSGATEADNLALKGVLELYLSKGDQIIVPLTEHKAILDTAHHLETQGKRITYLHVDRTGLIDLQELEDAITERTVLVSVMLANNETGTLQPVAEIGQICRRHGVLLHSDATQAVGKIPVDVDALNVDLLSLTAHKMHGPKGVGALYVRRRNPRTRLTSQMDGGGHERGMRSGTLNVPGIVGFGVAAELASQYAGRMEDTVRLLRDRLHTGLCRHIEGLLLNGHPTERLPNTLNVAFPGLESGALMAGMPDIAVATGSACSSASIDPSHVLTAMGLSAEFARCSIRFSLSRETTESEVDCVVSQVASAAGRLLRLTSPDKP